MDAERFELVDEQFECVRHFNGADFDVSPTLGAVFSVFVVVVYC